MPPYNLTIGWSGNVLKHLHQSDYWPIKTNELDEIWQTPTTDLFLFNTPAEAVKFGLWFAQTHLTTGVWKTHFGQAEYNFLEVLEFETNLSNSPDFTPQCYVYSMRTERKGCYYCLYLYVCLAGTKPAFLSEAAHWKPATITERQCKDNFVNMKANPLLDKVLASKIPNV